MHQPSISLKEEAPKPVKSPKGFVLQAWQKGLLLVLVLGVFWFRLQRRKKPKIKICSHCGKKNPPHRSNCENCSAPLFGS